METFEKKYLYCHPSLRLDVNVWNNRYELKYLNLYLNVKMTIQILHFKCEKSKNLFGCVIQIEWSKLRPMVAPNRGLIILYVLFLFSKNVTKMDYCSLNLKVAYVVNIFQKSDGPF